MLDMIRLNLIRVVLIKRAKSNGWRRIREQLPGVREKRLAYQKRWRDAHPDYKKAWNESHRGYYTERQTAFRARHPDKVDAARARYAERLKTIPELKRRQLTSFVNHHRKLRKQVLELYGGKCTCCGVDAWQFLQIDHINGGGRKHLLSFGNRLWDYYKWLLAEKREGFQVLCANCNTAKNYGICPHKRP